MWSFVDMDVIICWQHTQLWKAWYRLCPCPSCMPFSVEYASWAPLSFGWRLSWQHSVRGIYLLTSSSEYIDTAPISTLSPAVDDWVTYCGEWRLYEFITSPQFFLTYLRNSVVYVHCRHLYVHLYYLGPVSWRKLSVK